MIVNQTFDLTLLGAVTIRKTCRTGFDRLAFHIFLLFLVPTPHLIGQKEAERQ